MSVCPNLNGASILAWSAFVWVFFNLELTKAESMKTIDCLPQKGF
jgi:hypothetical protein